MKDIAQDRVREFQTLFLDRMHASHQDVVDALAAGKLDDALTAVLEKTAAEVIASM
jgi:F-type H+-transporting ATPase subunit alpha